MLSAEPMHASAPIVAPRNQDLSGPAQALAQQLQREIAAGNDQILTFEALEELLTALCTIYSGDVEQRGQLTPIRLGESANATSVLMTTTALLRGARLELFELGMWQSWSGMK